MWIKRLIFGSLIVAAAAWGDVFSGHDIVEEKADGSDNLAEHGGEDILTGYESDYKHFAANPETLVVANYTGNDVWIRIIGLGGDWKRKEQRVNAKANTSTQLDGRWWRVNYMKAEDRVSGGDVQVHAVIGESAVMDSSGIRGIIPKNHTQMQAASFSTGRGRKGQISSWRFQAVGPTLSSGTVNGSDSLSVGVAAILARELYSDGSVKQDWYIVDETIIQTNQGPVHIVYPSNREVPEFSDVGVRYALTGASVHVYTSIEAHIK